MCRRIKVALVIGAALGGAAAAASIAAIAGEAEGPCCFTNPRYTGVCRVTPAEDESCDSILAYLNNPSSSGKAYCGGTITRGGWQQVSCD
ncbi:MAG TPA: hypothetical protein PKJ99_16230 [Thermoanaerobaculales bacterium]|nr:hypothetical protein [Thermoanaerobaculales bacterium]HPA80884.1 hypothetical protein [Thermoanaerobaculales bacterium]HQN96201.1 hypothetical protein [Thermoanaerobaculales bacterium]HQP45038.1 hypothetical protein [Thermoanaerobaculales bacterium]